MSLDFEGVTLEETLKVDPSSVAESAVLGRLEEFAKDIEALRKELQHFQLPGRGQAELRQLVETAASLQAKVGLPQEVLSKDVLKQAGVPAEELEQARRLVSAFSTNEDAEAQCRQRLMEAYAGSASSSLEDLRKLLASWENLRKVERATKEETLSPFGGLDFGMEARREALCPICRSLCEQVQSTGSAEEKQQLEAFLSQAWFREALRSLSVEVPVLAAGSSRGRSTSRGASPGPFLDESKRLAEAAEAQAQAAAAAVARSRSPTPPPGVSAFRSAPSIAERTAVFGGSSPSSSSMGLTGKGDVDATATFGSTGLSSFVENEREELQRRCGQAPSSQDADVTFSAQHVPAVAVQQARSDNPRGQHAALNPKAVLRSGAPELWHAVHVGDEATIVRFIKQGACNGLMQDASGHSVLWHAIAFGHIGLAKLMLDSFPPGTEDGIDASEVHRRRGDTFLHLLCQCRPFSGETANLFKSLAAAMPRRLFVQVNAAGLSFLAIAVATMNFWVLKFVSLVYPEQTKALVCSEQAPLRSLAESIPMPSPPGVMHPQRIPEHFAISSLLSQDAAGRVPFADVAFDVGPKENEGRFLAHRVVIGAQSPVLLQELQSLPAQELPQEGITARVFKVDTRISKEVWRSVLQFLYTGVVQCPFAKDPAKMVELLRAAALYRLPKALLDVAQVGLFRMLPACHPKVALEVFSITAGSSGEGLDVRAMREASAHILLRSASETLKEVSPELLAGILDSLLQTVEQVVFDPARKLQRPAHAAGYGNACAGSNSQASAGMERAPVGWMR